MQKLILTGLCILSFLFSHAAIITVTSSADSGAGSLRDAIASATAGDSIQFAISNPDSIVVQSEIVIDKNLDIIGPGPDDLTISGSSGTRIINVKEGITVTISGLTFANGNLSSGSFRTGGAILNQGGFLTLNECWIRNNKASDGGGIANTSFPNITNPGNPGFNANLVLNYCKVFDNEIRQTGNRIARGAGILNEGLDGDTSSLSVNFSTVSGNRILNSNGYGAGICNTTNANSQTPGIALVQIVKSAIVHNAISSQDKSGIGGGIYNSPDGSGEGETSMSILNCTISGNLCESTITGSNSAAKGGGIHSYINNLNSSVILISKLDVYYSTITDNTVNATDDLGGGVYIQAEAPVQNLLNFNNNIVAGNHTLGTNTAATDIGDFISVEGYNLIGIADNLVSAPSIAGSLANPVDPLLGPLAMNGGPTPTHVLLPSSPAINAASPGPGARLSDQRGFARVGVSDLGAYEFNPNQSVSGIVSQSNGSPLANSQILLIAFDATDSSLTALDTSFTDNSGAYLFTGFIPPTVYVKAIPDSAVYPLEMPTYYDSSLVFQTANPISVTGNDTVNFNTISGANPGGPGFIGGLIIQGANKTPGDKLPGINLLLIDTLSKAVHGATRSDSKGEFSFSNLPLGTYAVWVDKPFIDNSLAPIFTLTGQNEVLENLSFELQSTQLEWVGVVDGIDVEHLWDENTYSLYPNPANNTVSFQWTTNTFGEKVEIKIFAPTGNMVKRAFLDRSDELPIPIQDLSAGLYLYSVSHRGEIKAIGKLMKR